jgi:hypothetical protein
MKAAVPAVPTVHIEQLRLVTDRAPGDGPAWALGDAFAAELDTALAARAPATRLHIGELEIHATGRQLADRQALRSLAERVARRILDATPE